MRRFVQLIRERRRWLVGLSTALGVSLLAITALASATSAATPARAAAVLDGDRPEQPDTQVVRAHA